MGKNKRLILEGIKNKRDRVVSVYDQYSKEIEYEEDSVKVYKKVLKMYEESIIEKEVVVRYLNRILKDEFFKEATVKIKKDRVVYSKGEHRIGIPIKGNVIEVVDLRLSKDPIRGDDSNYRYIGYYLKDLEERERLVKKYLRSNEREDLEAIRKHEGLTYIRGINVITDVHHCLKFEANRKIKKHYTKELLEELKDERKQFRAEYEVLQKEKIKDIQWYTETSATIKMLEDYEWLKEVGYEIIVVPKRK